ncbi:hypothetical protein P4391_23445, partial [Bacillus thuringiensis]|nr:hypothetical protein [Bacillus thuringiensis]
PSYVLQDSSRAKSACLGMEKLTLFHACGQTHSFLLRAALEPKTSSASRVNGLQADFALLESCRT